MAEQIAPHPAGGVKSITPATSATDLPQFMTVEEVATYWRCSTGVVYEGIRRGDIPARRIGRLLRIPREALS